MFYYGHPDPVVMEHPGRVLFDSIRMFAMQRTINRVHILDWVSFHVDKGFMYKEDVPHILGFLADYIELDPYDYSLINAGLAREQLIYYDNSDYFMNGTICVNEDGVYHYPSEEI